ncbi:MAG: transposase [Paenibacillus macerans]|uniref:Mu transposase C-terminal domain-containing protein n=1 Tax=Paenibacillus macerans TaxID=44252 RepID=UPI001F11912E|nr:Mu transposase C-terminal domain-containing protein [Paenibacillus macerans]MDU7473591.1 transposase [Paenibacillus macerans]MEC0139175.1 transposase [Paenibacillus macerans]UMV47256.1 Mu transposase C-terminal domain-containing protein [Paenibacillus macerans]
MAETYVTLEEAAGLEGVSYEAIKKKIQRNPDAFKTKYEPTTSGGKPRILVALSSLSKKARRAHKETQNIEGGDVVIEKRTSSEDVPWYIDADLDSYIKKFGKRYYEAVELAKSIQEFLNYADRDRTGFAEEFATQLGMSQRTLYRHSQAYLEASAWTLKLGKHDGKNYDHLKVLALCRKPKETFTFPSLSDAMKAWIENLWFDKRFAENQGTIDMLYTKLKQVASANGWDYPSYPTVARYIGYLMEVKRYKNARYLAEKGERMYRNKKLRKALQDMKSVPVMGLVQGDGHTFDVWVEYTHPNGKKTAIKPILVAWIDTRSRCIVGDIICHTPSAQAIKQSLLNMIYNEVGGVPQWIKIDNGKDFTAETLTGRKRSERISLDSEAIGFYRSIGIQDDFRSLPYQPWGKAEIERFFLTLVNRFEKWLLSYTGTLTGSRTSSKIKKDIPGMLERGELITMDELCTLWRKWRDEEYHTRQHRGLKDQGEQWHTPLEVFQNAERYFMAVPPRAVAATWLMQAEERVRVYQVGIRRFGYEYRAPELDTYIDDYVNIKWDANDVTRLYVYDRITGDKICEAESQELLQIAPRAPQKALEEHKRAQSQQLKADKQRLKDLTTPLEERIGQHIAAQGNLAGMFIGQPTGKAPKVVALPQDKQYKEEIRSKKARPAAVENDFYQKRAEKALAKLKELG